MKFIKSAIAAAAIAGGLLAASAGAAEASTPACTEGALTGYCGTQALAGDLSPLVFDVYRQGAFVNNKVIGYTNSDTDKATDFFQYAYDGGASKVFMYAPNGVPSNLCISEPSNLAGLVLRPCNGSKFQQFTATQVGSSTGYTWANAETGDVVEANGMRGQLTGAALPTGTPPAAEQWAFTS